MYSKQTVTIDPHREHVRFSPFTAPDRMSVFEVAPEHVAITTWNRGIVYERLNPRESFPSAFGDISFMGCH